MKKLIATSFILLALVSVLFTSCKKEYAVPPFTPVPFGDTLSIGDILAMAPKTTFDTASVCGIVTADEQSGNLYKMLFIQDRATGKAIELKLNTSSAARIGDSVRVCLNSNIMYNPYHNLPQLTDVKGNGFSPDGHLLIYPYNRPIEPKTVTIAEIKSGNYIGALVKLDSVEFFEKNTTFCEVGETTNRHLIDASSPSLDNDFVVRTSNYANFAYDYLPVSKGSLVAIASIYNSTYQLLLTSKSDMDFAVWGGAAAPAGEVQSMPYVQSFETDFGTYTTYSVEGAQTWTIDYSSANITGHEGGSGGVDYANEDWLISSPVAITGVDHAKAVINYVAKYNAPVDNDITIQISEDYKYGTNPANATWTQLPEPLENNSPGSAWTFSDTEVNLDKFVGKTVTLAVKFISTNSGSRTIEIKSITVTEGLAGGGTPNPPAPGGELQTMPYMQSFETEFGSYMTFDVFGPQSWMIDFQTAKMTGYAGGSNANEDWLISSPVAVKGVSEAKVSVNYSAQYQNSNPLDVTLQVSTDYVYGNAPATAKWTQMSSTYPNTSSFNDFKTVEASLNDFIGQNVTVAIKYTSTDSQSRTIEVKSITVQEGQASGGDTPPTPPTPGEGEGSGTQDDPYNVASGITLQSEEPVAWVRGYIVGAVKSGNSTVDDNSQINWSAPFDLATNVVIADDANCREISQCIIVNLPNGKPLRTQVNLMDNPGNLGKLLSVKGKLRKYFGQAGLRDSGGTESDFMLEGGAPPVPVGTVYLDEGLTSESSFGKFLPYSVNGDEVWHFDSRYGAVMSGYANNMSHANEDWFISAPIDLSNSTNPVLVFEHSRGPAGSMGVGVAEGYYTVWAISEYDGSSNPASMQWTELTGVNHPTVTWQYISSGELSIPSALRGPNTRIAFKYLCTDNESATWEIKNVKVKEQ